jgi:sulfonate transport system permease protein
MSALAPPPPAAVPAGPGAGRTGPRSTGGSAAPRPAPRRRGVRLGWLRRWVSPVVIVVVWQLLSSAGVIPEQKIASPLQVLATARDLVADGTLGSATLVSVQRVGLGFAVGAAIGVTLAVAAGLSRLGEDAVDPPMQMLRTLPHFGLIPLFIVWMGLGETPKIALVAMGVMFPLYLNTFAGIRSIDRRFLEAATTLHLTRWQRIRHVVVPGAVPQALVGLRQSLGVAWLSLIVAETVSASSGLGYMINHAREFLQTDVIVVGLAVYSILGLVTDAIVRTLERKALSWRP